MGDTRTQITARVGSVTSSVGNYEPPAMTRRTELINVDWKTNLAMEGLVYRMTVGTMVAGGIETMITGGGNGTVVNGDQPELGISVREGYYLVPMEIIVSTRCKLDADTQTTNILVIEDRAAGVPADGTKTAATPLNLLDGGPAFPGDAFTACTADMTDPTVSAIIAHASILGNDNGTAGNLSFPELALNYCPTVPEFIAGPCSVYVYWGGTAATEGLCSALFAAIPTSYLG